MNIHGSYFSFTAAYSPFPLLDRWLHPYKNAKVVMIGKFPITIEWTQRAEQQMSLQKTPLIAEMQIYFSCVVKKRVLFHDSSELETTTVDDKLAVCFRAVESNSCDPVEFASNFPVKNSFTSTAALKMHPKTLSIDFKHNDWVGEFTI